MKINRFIISGILLLAVGGVFMLKYFTMLFDSNESATVVSHSYSFADNFSDKQKLASAVENIFIGEVLREDGITKTSMGVETQFIVGVTQNVKGALLGEIKVKQKGGFYKEKGRLYFQQYEKDSLLKKGQMYMFAATLNRKSGNYEIMPKYGFIPLFNEEQKIHLIEEIKEVLK